MMTSDEIDAAFKKAYQKYLEYVDYRDRLPADSPERPCAQAVVEAFGEAMFMLSAILRPTEAGNPQVQP